MYLTLIPSFLLHRLVLLLHLSLLLLLPLLLLVLQVVDQALRLSQRSGQSAVRNNVPYLLELFPDLLLRPRSPCLVVCLFLLEFQESGVVLIDVLLILVLELSDEADGLLVRIWNGVYFLVYAFEAEQRLSDFLVLQVIVSFGLGECR